MEHSRWLKKVKVRGFRGIVSYQELKLAIPDNKNPGSGLTILVGPNGGGKSTFLEIISLIGNNSDEIMIQEIARNEKTNGEVCIQINYTDGTALEMNNLSPNYLLKRVQSANQGSMAGKVYQVPSRRQLDTNFSRSKTPRSGYSQESTTLRIERDGFSRPIARLVDLAEDTGAKETFDALLKDILGFGLDWKLDLRQTNFYFKISTSSGTHDTSGLGFGIISLIFVLDGLRDLTPGDLVIIDEPELSQHPSVQRRLSKLLVEKSKDNQIVIATHSPYFADISSLDSGTEIARVANSRGTKVYQMSDNTKASLLKLKNDLNNPHTVGLEAREVLFLDEGVILSEGQDDVVLLPKLANQVKEELKFTLYGWGVGGAEKMEIICNILKDLGLKKVIGLLDSDRTRLAAKLRRMFPKYRFFTLPAADIRDKKARKATGAKPGMSTSSGKIYSKYEDDFVRLVKEMNSL